MELLFVQMGGTIDKDYNDVPHQDAAREAMNFLISDPAYERILDVVTPPFPFRSVCVAQKDSLDLDNDDRQKLLEICRDAPEGHIVITHGTDTMKQTCEVLDVIKNKTIIVTGSMRPERFVRSDAHFNVGSAIGAVQTASPGVYIAMSGLVLPWRQIKKDYGAGNFAEA